MIPWADSRVLTGALLERGFVHVYDDDRKDRNFVMTHRSHGRIDFHVFDLVQGGAAVYGPGEIDWVISESELSAEGSIGGRKVRCLSANYQVRAHSGYMLQDTDFADMSALHRRFGGSHKFKLGIGELLWRWTLVSTIPFPSYEPLPACFGEH